MAKGEALTSEDSVF